MRLASLSLTIFVFVSVSTGISASQDTNFPAGPQYLLTGSPLLAHPIATPTLWLDSPLPPIPSLPQIGPVVNDQPYVPNPALPNQPDLFPIYYGYPMPSVVELVSTEPKQLPASITDTGVVEVTTVQSLIERGYGVTLPETASFWKSHAPRATRVYTNADIDRLHGS